MVEYKIRPVIRYLITRFEQSEHGGSSSVIGEFQNEQVAEDVFVALSSHSLQEPGLEERVIREVAQAQPKPLAPPEPSGLTAK